MNIGLAKLRLGIQNEPEASHMFHNVQVQNLVC
jgi:hypothetical protein